MKKEIFQEIEIPEGVEVNIEGSMIEVKGQAGTNKKEFDITNLSFEKKDNQIIIGHKKATKKEKKMINTLASHIKNMIKGVQEKFEYQLKICFSHFPISVEIKGNEALIKNFLGEKIPRKVKIPEEIEVKADKEHVSVSGIDKELTGQVAANFEKATRVPAKDRRVFQDGIFITSKAGRQI